MMSAARTQRSVPVLLAAAVFLLVFRWLLPSTAYACQAAVGVAALLVLFSSQKWARNQWWTIESSASHRQKRLRATPRYIGFSLVVVGWLFAMFPNSLAVLHEYSLPGNVTGWMAALLVILVVAIFAIAAAVERIKSHAAETASIKGTVEDRLDELERLKRRDMVTAEEYAAKRQEILNDL